MLENIFYPVKYARILLFLDINLIANYSLYLFLKDYRERFL
jgi:hypothetical protein